MSVETHVVHFVEMGELYFEEISGVYFEVTYALYFVEKDGEHFGVKYGVNFAGTASADSEAMVVVDFEQEDETCLMTLNNS